MSGTTYLGTTPRRATKMWGTAPTADTTAPAVTLTAPSENDSGTVACANMNNARFMFFTDAGAANEACKARIFGWSRTKGVDTWIPSYICQVTLTVGAKTGVASGVVTNTMNFVDTIAFNSGDATVKVNSNAIDEIASLVIDLEGAEFVTVQFTDLGTGAEVDDMNALCELI